MRPTPLLTVVALVSMMFGPVLLGAEPSNASATAATSGTTDPEDPGAARAAAERTLASVEDAVRGGGAVLSQGRADRDLTVQLRDLRLALPRLSGPDRARARSLLARPTDGFADDFGDGYTAPRSDQEDDCGSGEPGAGADFCIHWVTSTSDRPDLTDTSPSNGIPDYVDTVRATMDTVWRTEVDRAGYRAPRRDAGPPDAGPNRKLDIYLVNIGEQSLYGYCATEPIRHDAGADTSGYCVLDDDYSSGEFPANTPVQNLQVTAAHEFFHMIQFGYDAHEDVWFMEGTATWMEDEVFDAVDDNRYYLVTSPLSDPGRPLDSGKGLFVYGNWLWWRYLSETHPADEGSGVPVIIRHVWEKADDSDPGRPGTYSLKATRRALKDVGTTLTDSLADFGVANRRPRTSYEEGAAYDHAPLQDSFRLARDVPSVPSRVTTLDHLSNRTYAFLPGDDVPPGSRLRVKVDAPVRHNPAVEVTTVSVSGTYRTRRVDLDERGLGSARVAFGDDVARVELTITNAGHHYTCARRTQLSCRGLSQDDNTRTTFRARLL